jgi:hypothetical protein
MICCNAVKCLAGTNRTPDDVNTCLCVVIFISKEKKRNLQTKVSVLIIEDTWIRKQTLHTMPNEQEWTIVAKKTKVLNHFLTVCFISPQNGPPFLNRLHAYGRQTVRVVLFWTWGPVLENRTRKRICIFVWTHKLRRFAFVRFFVFFAFFVCNRPKEIERPTVFLIGWLQKKKSW